MPLLDPPTDPELAGPRHRLAEPQRRRFRVDDVPAWLWAVLALAVCALVVTLVYGFSRDATSTRTPTGAPVVAPTPTVTVVPVAPPTADLPEGAFAGDSRDDFYVIGLEVDPGTYTSAGPLDPEVAGQWEVYRSPSWSRDRDGTSIGPVTVELRRGQVFHTVGFKPWHRGP